ncbi:MAG: hypothetical protein R3C46_10565 [Hyphomonadaceae bacterium]
MTRLPAFGLVIGLAGIPLNAAAQATAQPPAAEVVDISLLGKSAIEQFKTYEDDGSCPVGSPSTECRVNSPAGIEYTTIKGVVCEITVQSSRLTGSVILPFGLQLGLGVDDVVRLTPKDQAGGRLFLHDGRRGFESGDVAIGDLDHTIAMLMWFDLNERLATIHFSDPCYE